MKSKASNIDLNEFPTTADFARVMTAAYLLFRFSRIDLKSSEAITDKRVADKVAEYADSYDNLLATLRRFAPVDDGQAKFASKVKETPVSEIFSTYFFDSERVKINEFSAELQRVLSFKISPQEIEEKLHARLDSAYQSLDTQKKFFKLDEKIDNHEAVASFMESDEESSYDFFVKKYGCDNQKSSSSTYTLLDKLKKEKASILAASDNYYNAGTDASSAQQVLNALAEKLSVIKSTLKVLPQEMVELLGEILSGKATEITSP